MTDKNKFLEIMSLVCKNSQLSSNDKRDIITVRNLKYIHSKKEVNVRTLVWLLDSLIVLSNEVRQAYRYAKERNDKDLLYLTMI